jgi:hypothetical protein
MTSATSLANTVSPIGDDSRVVRILKVLGWIGAGALVLGALDLLDIDVWGWSPYAEAKERAHRRREGDKSPAAHAEAGPG